MASFSGEKIFLWIFKARSDAKILGARDYPNKKKRRGVMSSVIVLEEEKNSGCKRSDSVEGYRYR